MPTPKEQPDQAPDSANPNPPQSLHETTDTEADTDTDTPATMPTPRRLFIASIGNQKPYRTTRHSAGHILLDALSPLLPSSSLQPSTYTTWYSPSYMNESGPKLVRQLQRWLEKVDAASLSTPTSGWISSSGVALPLSGTGSAGAGPGPGAGTGTGTGTGAVPATLVILHDELEAPLGKIRIKRGGPEASSLRGHRGLISSFESLRGKGLYPGKPANANAQGQAQRSGKKSAVVPRDLSVLRVGVGIGRPDSRGKNAVADYVLTEMDGREMEAVRGAVGGVLPVLEEEVFWSDGKR